MISDNIPPTVAVLGGDPVVGKAIEAMLLGAGYEALSFAVPPMNGSRHLLDGARVWLLAPGISATERKAFLDGRAETPVVELVTILEDVLDNDRSGRLPWPVGIGEIGKGIDAALLGRADSASSIRNPPRGQAPGG